jgi:murein L,D-transpeptidase YcbB/YkuD
MSAAGRRLGRCVALGCLLAVDMCLTGAAAVAVGSPQLVEAIRGAVRTGPLQHLYEPRGFEPLWVDEDGLTANGERALNVLRRAPDEGLDAADYLDPGLARLVAGAAAPPRGNLLRLASIDVAISQAILRYVDDLYLGRIDPAMVGYQMSRTRDADAVAARLSDELARRDVEPAIDSFKPRLAQYAALRRQLARYRLLAEDDRIVSPALPETSLRPGDAYGSASQLASFLAAVGDLPPEAARGPVDPLYREPLVGGIRAFQGRHGLDPDGIIGPRTRAALQVPLARRVRQIELALERLRWLPDFGDRRLIAINIPMYHLWAWDAVRPDGVPVLDMDVIVGAAVRHETPVLVDELEQVIFRPWWNVPRSIVISEIVPAIQRDPAYLRRQNMEIVGGAANGVQPATVTPELLADIKRGAVGIRQRPGPGNALGLVKFAFPNDQNVYMHGTPAQELFARSRRDFSHGCVRLADPVALAEWVLQESGQWSRDRITAAMNGANTVTVNLNRPIPVVLFYTTAVVIPENGSVWFAEDVYGGDRRLETALAQRRR